MKKFSVMLAIVATLVGSNGYAQTTSGKGAAAAKSSSSDFAWGIGLTGLAVLGVVVGVTAAAASSSPSSFSH